MQAGSQGGAELQNKTKQNRWSVENRQLVRIWDTRQRNKTNQERMRISEVWYVKSSLKTPWKGSLNTSA